MIIDAQVHTWARPDGRYPWSAQLLATLPGEVQRIYAGHPLTTELIVPMMDQAGVDMALLTSPWLYGADHSYAFDGALRHPGRFGVVGPFTPPVPQTRARLSDFAARPWSVGVRLFLASPAAPDHERRRTDVDAFLAAAADVGTTIFLGPMGRLDEAGRVARAFPGVQIVLDHLGLWMPAPVPTRLSLVEDLLELSIYPNILLKCSAVPELSAAPYPFEDLWPTLHRVVGAFGADRLMWGSDITQHLGKLTYQESLDYLRLTNEISMDDKKLILGGTAQKHLAIAAAQVPSSASREN